MDRGLGRSTGVEQVMTAPANEAPTGRLRRVGILAWVVGGVGVLGVLLFLTLRTGSPIDPSTLPNRRRRAMSSAIRQAVSFPCHAP